MMVIQQLVNYAIHLLAGVTMIGVFVTLYIRFTPFDELALIRQGASAAALSLSGATLGFALTVASSILHNDNLAMFALWAGLACIVQMLAYALVSRMLPGMAVAIREDNRAMGGLMGMVSLVIGVVNAACLS